MIIKVDNKPDIHHMVFSVEPYVKIFIQCGHRSRWKRCVQEVNPSEH